LFNVRSSVLSRRSWIRAIEKRLKRREASPDFTVEFLQAELERVIYGLGVYTRDDYLACDRDGRERQLQRRQRELVWDVVMGDDRPSHWAHRRIEAHRQAVAGGLTPFSHVLVDEAQDMTRADFQVLERLVTDPHHLTIFVDRAQALHLGGSYQRPPEVRGARWLVRELDGSHRLPFHVSEAAHPLPEALRSQANRRHRGARARHGADITVTPSTKTAVVGPRPIVIAGSKSAVAADIRDVIRRYRRLIDAAPESQRLVTIAEGDPWIEEELGDRFEDLPVRRESMLAIKGLERPCIVWSTIDDEN
jgi:hypothetical protein